MISLLKPIKYEVIFDKIPEPFRADGAGATDLGPRDILRILENPDMLVPPTADAGTVPNLRFSFKRVLERPAFINLDVVLHLHLRMLIRNTDRLSEPERRFVQNILTHTDFLIFHKLYKSPILVVEADGYAFHANNPRQLERDRMKDAILAKYNIPILRLATNERKPG